MSYRTDAFICWLVFIVAFVPGSNADGQWNNSANSTSLPNNKPFAAQIEAARSADESERASVEVGQSVPPDFRPWWVEQQANALQQNSVPAPVDLEFLLLKTLEHSAQVKVFSDLPLIRETQITEACANFDWQAFMSTRWDDTNDPVGNILTTGGASRYKNNQWVGSAGMRRVNSYGGRIEAAQDVGFQNTNSTFFQPNDQGTARMRLSYIQPLARGRGQVYNTSLVVLARIDTTVAKEEFSRQLQAHLLEVSRAYWGLYLERVTLIQKRNLLKMAEDIEQSLSARRNVDVVASQLARISSTVSARRAELIRAEMSVRNAQDRINALVNDPILSSTQSLELIPADIPVNTADPLDVGDALATALQNRPEVHQAIQQIKAGSVRLNMSRNELLPQFDFIAETYVAGLRGDSNIGGAWSDQFGVGGPGYAVGFQYAAPVGNRAAKARVTRRTIEVRQLQNQFRATAETLLMETKVATREIRTSYQETQATYLALQAANNRFESIRQRWAHLPGQEQSIGLYLEDLLKAQADVTQAEFEFAKAQTTYNLSLINIKRATGSLLDWEQVTVDRTVENCVPRITLHKPTIAEPGPSR